jgi:hypothetical protein
MRAPSEPVVFRAADLSATQSSDWIPRRSTAKKGCVGIGWPATGTPVGALTIEESDSPLSTSGALLATLTTTPTGGAASTMFTFETAAPYVRIKYTAASGGTGAAWTNSTGTAGTTPTLTWSI